MTQLIHLQSVSTFKQIFITQLRMTGTESRDQYTPITTMMLVVPVDAVNFSRPYSCGALIL